MGTEPDAELDATQRRLAEAAEKRRAAEAEQDAAKVHAGYYATLRDTHRRVADEDMNRAAAPERGPVTSIEEFEARVAAKQSELQEKHRLGLIARHERVRPLGTRARGAWLPETPAWQEGPPPFPPYPRRRVAWP